MPCASEPLILRCQKCSEALGIAGVIWYGGYEVTQGITTPGTFATFITALLMLYEPLKTHQQV